MTDEQLVLLIDILDKLGYNTETAGTLTAFQRLTQIAEYVDTLETNLGTTGDAANAAGTVLARLAELLTNRLTAARAGYLDAAVSSRATSASIGTSADGRATNTVMGWLNSPIKSWQRVTFTPNTNAAFAVAISSVVPEKCIVLLNGYDFGADSSARPWSVLRYISAFLATSISFAQSYAPYSSGYGTHSVIIIEFY
ncbi:MAG: hypothetical protein VR68_11565 [Peptococcaceae bacterium BRH_c4a]|nr:MAG: hypothetical protein VR68_11565 [Peptococcaceae bacterium BRH_c4a]